MGLPSPSFARALALLGALLAISALAVVGRLATAAHAAPGELFFSEYVEGSSNNKALEIFNGTGAPVTLTGTYDVQIFANGSALATATIPLTGTVADGDVFVLAQVNAVAAILAQSDQTTSNFLFNGDDSSLCGSPERSSTSSVRSGPIREPNGARVRPVRPTTRSSGSRPSRPVTPTARTRSTRRPSGMDSPSTRSPGLAAHSVSGGGPAIHREEEAGSMRLTMRSRSTRTTKRPSSVSSRNDSGSALAVVSVTDPANGDVTIARRRRRRELRARRRLQRHRFVHVLRLGFERTERHGDGDCDGFPVNDDPDPEDDAASTSEDTAVTVDVLTNDDDVDGDSLSVSVVEGARPRRRDGGGGREARELRSRPRLERRRDTRVRRSRMHTAEPSRAEIVLTVISVNDPPTRPCRFGNGRRRRKRSCSTFSETTWPAQPTRTARRSSSPRSVLPRTARPSCSRPAADAGKVRYTPTAGYAGADSFSYVLSDGIGDGDRQCLDHGQGAARRRPRAALLRRSSARSGTTSSKGLRETTSSGHGAGTT